MGPEKKNGAREKKWGQAPFSKQQNINISAGLMNQTPARRDNEL